MAWYPFLHTKLGSSAPERPWMGMSVPSMAPITLGNWAMEWKPSFTPHRRKLYVVNGPVDGSTNSVYDSWTGCSWYPVQISCFWLVVLWPKTVKLPRPKLKLEYLLHALNNILVGLHHLCGGHTIVTSPSVANCVHSSFITILKTISYCK